MGSFRERGSCPLFAMDFRSASAKEKRITVGFVVSFILVPCDIPGVPIKTDPLVYFDDNFGKHGPILTIFSLLQQEIHDAQKLSYSATSPLLCCHFT